MAGIETADLDDPLTCTEIWVKPEIEPDATRIAKTSF